jgi:hypothetical protein
MAKMLEMVLMTFGDKVKRDPRTAMVVLLVLFGTTETHSCLHSYR